MSSRHPHWLLCGGIGSGKSEVRRLLAERGVHTIDADAVGHAVLLEEGLSPVAERWPEVVFEGQIRREALARIVFDDANELGALEAITHPLIFGRIQAELEGFSGLTVVEVPLLDSPLALPRMVVDADVETRLRRAIGRGASREDVERRMASQPDREAWLAAADVVVPNHGTMEDLAGTVSRLAIWLTDAK